MAQELAATPFGSTLLATIGYMYREAGRVATGTLLSRSKLF
jgi:hypothetical protein